MWTWNADPFGTDAANPNPSGAGSFAYNLRFAGQVFDGQAELHYNWNRWFDPADGKYQQSDPLGLSAGLNPYAYVDPIPWETWIRRDCTNAPTPFRRTACPAYPIHRFIRPSKAPIT